MAEPGEVTLLLTTLRRGDRGVLDQLLPAIYEHLRAIAHRELRRERTDHTLSTTALVHEVYLKLSAADTLTWKDRAHFFAVCAQAMRRVLVNYAIEKQTGKRGANAPHLPLDDAMVAAQSRPDDLLWVNDSLDRLTGLNPRLTRVVECRVFGGMSVKDTAEALALSPATVKRDWTLARAWLRRDLEAGT
jgi:RNA polymerase sigma factor (TIGR02999 family)